MAEQRAAGYRWFDFEPKDSAAGRRLVAASPGEQRGFVLAAMKWLDHRSRNQPSPDYEASWAVRRTMEALLRRRLPLGHDDVVALLDWSIRQPYTFVRSTPQVLKAVRDHLKEHELTPALQDGIGGLAGLLETGYTTAETRRWAARLKELGGLAAGLPLVPGEAWSDSAIEEIEAVDGEARMAWGELLNLCAKAGGAKPTAKWSKEAGALIETRRRRAGRPPRSGGPPPARHS